MRVRASVVVAALALALAGLHAGPGADRASAAPSCPGQGDGTTDLSGLVGGAQPVILVHGWTGSPLGDTRTKMEHMSSGSMRQYFLFDYKRYNTGLGERRQHRGLSGGLHQAGVRPPPRAWRQRPGVPRGALNMGGLAVRVALDERYGGIPDLADRVGGVVTLDAPNTGSMWGHTWVAQLAVADE